MQCRRCRIASHAVQPASTGTDIGNFHIRGRSHSADRLPYLSELSFAALQPAASRAVVLLLSWRSSVRHLCAGHSR